VRTALALVALVLAGCGSTARPRCEDCIHGPTPQAYFDKLCRGLGGLEPGSLVVLDAEAYGRCANGQAVTYSDGLLP
jgi:hypothetical protein